MSENQVNNKFTQLIEILTSFYPIGEDIISKLNDNYLELSDEDLAFLDERATELLDFHDRFSKERDQYPELSNELYRLQINAIKEFLLNKSKEFQSVGDYSKIKDVIEPINEILENIPKTEEITPGPVASTQSNADQDKKIEELEKQLAYKEKEIVRLNLEDTTTQAPTDTSEVDATAAPITTNVENVEEATVEEVKEDVIEDTTTQAPTNATIEAPTVASEVERQKTLSEELSDLQKNKIEIPTGVNTDDMAALIAPQMNRR